MKATTSVRGFALVALMLTGFGAWIGLGGCGHAGAGSPALAGAVPPGPAASPATHPDADFGISCKECHAEDTPEVYARWDEGPHGRVNVGCFVCHGDAQEEFLLAAAPETCRGCHDEQYETFATSDRASCFVCHDGHSLTFHGR